MIGGWAAIIHGLPRTTLDVDLFVRPTRENAARIAGALSEIGFGIGRELTPDEILSRSVLLFADQIRVDLFTKPWGLASFEDCWSRRLDVDLDGVLVPALSWEDLEISKQTGRTQDEADLAALRTIRERRSGRPSGA